MLKIITLREVVGPRIFLRNYTSTTIVSQNQSNYICKPFIVNIFFEVVERLLIVPKWN